MFLQKNIGFSAFFYTFVSFTGLFHLHDFLYRMDRKLSGKLFLDPVQFSVDLTAGI